MERNFMQRRYKKVLIREPGTRVQTVLNRRYLQKFNRIKEVYNFETDSQTMRYILRNFKDPRLSDDENDVTKLFNNNETKE